MLLYYSISIKKLRINYPCRLFGKQFKQELNRPFRFKEKPCCKFIMRTMLSRNYLLLTHFSFAFDGLVVFSSVFFRMIFKGKCFVAMHTFPSESLVNVESWLWFMGVCKTLVLNSPVEPLIKMHLITDYANTV